MIKSISLLAAIILMTGCTTMSPLSLEEKSQIKTVHIDNQLGNQLNYVKLGTTIFGNKESDFSDDGLLNNLVASIQEELKTRGYAVSDSLKDSDISLSLIKGLTYNYPSRRGVDGAGFFVHIVLGINHGVQAQARIIVRLDDPGTGKTRYVEIIDRIKITTVKTNANEWNDFSESDKKELITQLSEQLSGVATEALDKIGL